MPQLLVRLRHEVIGRVRHDRLTGAQARCGLVAGSPRSSSAPQPSASLAILPAKSRAATVGSSARPAATPMRNAVTGAPGWLHAVGDVRGQVEDEVHDTHAVEGILEPQLAGHGRDPLGQGLRITARLRRPLVRGAAEPRRLNSAGILITSW